MTIYVKRFANEKVFEYATDGRHSELTTVYIKHNLFHQSKFGRDVDHQNTNIVPFKSPYDVMLVKTSSTHLGLGSELIYLHPDATFVLYCHSGIDLSPGTDDRLCYCTNTRSIPSKFYSPD